MPPRNRKTEDKAADAVAPEPDENEETVAPIAPEPDSEPEKEEPEGSGGGFTLLNPDNTPVVYTEDGKVIGAGERVQVTQLDEAGQAALDRGYLTKID